MSVGVSGLLAGQQAAATREEYARASCYLPDLDDFRGLAILMVVLRHIMLRSPLQY